MASIQDNSAGRGAESGATGDSRPTGSDPPRARVLVIGDFLRRDDAQPVAGRAPRRIDRESFAKAMREMGVGLSFEVRDTVSPEGRVMPLQMQFGGMRDFDPEVVAGKLPNLAGLLAERAALRALQGPLGGEKAFRNKIAAVVGDPRRREELLETLGLADGPRNATDALIREVLLASHMEPGDEGYEVADRAIRAFLRGMVKRGIGEVHHRFVTELIAEIDPLLSRQMDEVLHHAEFRALEASWLGLRRLVSEAEAGMPTDIEVLACSQDDLLADFEDSPPGALQSGLGQIMSRPGREITAVLADYVVGPDPAGLALLQGLASLAGATKVPILAAAAPSFFGIGAYSNLGDMPDPKERFRATPFRRFQAIREAEGAAHVGLLLPRVLMRIHYSASTMPVRSFNYEEAGPEETETCCWGNPIYAFGTHLLDRLASHPPGARFSVLETRGPVPQLPTEPQRDPSQTGMLGPTEGAISEKLAEDLRAEGFTGLVQRAGAERTCDVKATALAAANVAS